MKNKYGIGIIVLSVLFLYFISFGAYQEYSKTENETKIQISSANGSAYNMSGYYLYEVNGYVVVFENDKITPYEYTDILYEELPELLKQEIKNGKYIKNEEELYGFLENYTS